MPSTSGSPAPLSEPVLYVLLSLADQPRHGYGIILQVEEWTEGRLRLRTGTLYTALRRLREQGWIDEVDVPDADDQRRVHYRLAPAGRDLLRAETERIGQLAALAARVIA